MAMTDDERQLIEKKIAPDATTGSLKRLEQLLGRQLKMSDVRELAAIFGRRLLAEARSRGYDNDI